MVVPVLITSCQVSEKPNIGPDIAQTKITVKAVIKARGEPVVLVTLFDIFWNKAESLFFFFVLRITSYLENAGIGRPELKTRSMGKKKSGQEWPDTSRP